MIFYNFVWRNFANWVICYWPAAEPLADARKTLGFRGTLVENHSCRPMCEPAVRANNCPTLRPQDTCYIRTAKIKSANVLMSKILSYMFAQSYSHT